MTPLEQTALLELMRDLGRGDETLLTKMEAAIAQPPRTTEEIGFYVSDDETDFANCFRKLCSLLDDSEYGTSVEDKYCTEIFEHWLESTMLDELPAAVHHAIPEDGYFGETDPDEERKNVREHFPAAAREIEAAFDAKGSPLLSLDTGRGDTLIFVIATPGAAKRWRDVELGRTHDGDLLAVRSPMWHTFWEFIECAGADNLGAAPDDLPGPRQLRPVSQLDFTQPA